MLKLLTSGTCSRLSQTMLLWLLALLLVGAFWQSGATECPDDWTVFQGSCYVFIDDFVGWTDAWTICKTLDSKIVTIETPDENDFVSAQLRMRGGTAVEVQRVYNCFLWRLRGGVEEFYYLLTSLTRSKIKGWTRDTPHVGRGDSASDYERNITFLVGGLVRDRGAWIGFQDFVKEGHWVLADTQEASEYTHWAPGEPNNDQDQDCGTIRGDGQWDDDVCGATHQVVCEKP